MMATTHALAALTLVTPLAFLVPEFAGPLAVGAIVGGIFPDLDVLFDHRRTLHYPVAGGAVALPAMLVSVAIPSPGSVAVASAAGGAWLHAASDVIGDAPVFDPWESTRDEAVYNHVTGRWIRARRWIRYDGAPEDAALGVLLAIPPVLVFDRPIVALTLLGIVISLGYALGRRHIARQATE